VQLIISSFTHKTAPTRSLLRCARQDEVSSLVNGNHRVMEGMQMQLLHRVDMTECHAFIRLQTKYFRESLLYASILSKLSRDSRSAL
jgi:hypothetical protein